MKTTKDTIKTEKDKLEAALKTPEKPSSRALLLITGYTTKQIHDAFITRGSYTVTPLPPAALLLEV